MAIQYLPATAVETPPGPASTDPASPGSQTPPPSPSSPPILVLFGRDRAGKPCAAWFDADQAEAAIAAADTMQLRTLPVADEDQRGSASQLAHGRILPNGKAYVPRARRDLYARLVTLAGDNAGLGVGAPPVAGGAGDRTAEPGETAVPAAADAPAAGGDHPARDAPSALTAKQPDATAEAIASAEVPPGPTKPRPGDRTFVGAPTPAAREEIGLGSVVLAHEGHDDGWWEAEVIGINGGTFSLRWVGYDPVTFPTILRKGAELALLPPAGVV